MRNLLSVLLTLVILVFLAFPIKAAERNGTITVEPAFIDVELKKGGETKDIIFTFGNNSSTPIELQFSTIDFKQKDENGALTFLTGKAIGQYSYSLSSYLSLETNSLLFAPNESKKMSVRVTNRPDISPGGHYAAMVAKVVTAGSQEQNTQINAAVSSMILVRKIGGERYKLSLKDSTFPNGLVSFSYPRNFKLLFQNEGNIHLIPYGRVEIKDMFGKVISKGVINTSSLIIFPETRRYILVEMKPIEKSWPVSFNRIEVTGNDSLHKTKYMMSESYLYLNPWFVIIIVGVIVMGGYGWWRMGKHGRRT